MLSLPELQQRFVAAILDGEGAEFASEIDAVAKGPGALERLGVYRNNWREGFRKALASGFPVLARLVGPDYFRQLALEFLAAHPSRSGDLEHIGAPLPAFLERRFADSEYAYLGDVAALEWACQQVLAAADHVAATADTLHALNPAGYGALRFRLHPAARLLASPFPVSRIWLANQPAAEIETIDLASGGEQLLVRYAASGLELHRLRRGEFALAQALAPGGELGDALATAQDAAPDSDLASGLHRLLAIGALDLICRSL